MLIWLCCSLRGIAHNFLLKQLTSYKDPYFLAFFALVGVYVTMLTYVINFSKCSMLRRFAWGSCGGSITGMQNFLKDSLTLFNASGNKGTWLLPFFFSMAGASAFIGLLILTACMKRYDATYSAASFVGSFVISASIMSEVHYHTLSRLENLWNLILYPVGLLVLMLGVYILVKESHEPDELLIDDDEEVVPMRKNSDDSQVRHDERNLFSMDIEQVPLRRWPQNVDRYLSCTPKSKTTERQKIRRFKFKWFH